MESHQGPLETSDQAGVPGRSQESLGGAMRINDATTNSPSERNSSSASGQQGSEATSGVSGQSVAASLDIKTKVASFFQRLPRIWRRAPEEAAPKSAGSKGRLTRPTVRSRATLRKDLPPWLVSFVLHAAILTPLGLATLTTPPAREVPDIDSAMVDTELSSLQAEELVHIYAEPTNAPRTLASDTITTAFGQGGALTAIGAPSVTPGVATTDQVREASTLPSVQVMAPLSGSGLKPPSTLLAREIGGGRGGLVAGDVTRGVQGAGEALDQLAREIMRHLQDHKLTVVWMFDESGSMKDDQRAISEKFSRVSGELKLKFEEDHQPVQALNHVIMGFGKEPHFQAERPTDDIELIAKAIQRLRVDSSGEENTFQALGAVIARYGNLVSEDRRLLIVLVTDESGDDGVSMEEARQLVVSRSVPIYVIGRQAIFGKAEVVLPYTDPVTKDVYWPTIRRGPESAELECLQYDGLFRRNDEQPSGFAPYELARLAKDTGGIYFLLPSEEDLRHDIFQKEQAYSLASLKEYVPDYESRALYLRRAQQSPLRRNLLELVNQSQNYGFRRHFPIEPGAFVEAIDSELPKAVERVQMLVTAENRLRSLDKDRDREPDKRWQAHYDLVLGQVAAYQVKAYEYGATLTVLREKAARGEMVPSKRPIPDQLVIEWEINHSKELRAPAGKTSKQIGEATRLLKLVIERHPDTPWSASAQDDLARGFGCRWSEWQHNPKHADRAALVPKY